jgi:hypothetical protein
VRKVKPLFGKGIVDGNILIVDYPDQEVRAFREKGFDSTIGSIEADSPQCNNRSFARSLAIIDLPFECKIKLTMVFEP